MREARGAGGTDDLQAVLRKDGGAQAQGRELAARGERLLLAVQQSARDGWQAAVRGLYQSENGMSEGDAG